MTFFPILLINKFSADRRMKNNTSKTLVFLTVVFVVLACHVVKADKDEPTCYSRFDYDLKMLETVADMKHNQKVLTETVNKLQDLVEKLVTSAVTEHDTLQQLVSSVSKQNGTLGNLGGRVSRESNKIKKLKSSVINQQKALENLESMLVTPRENLQQESAPNGNAYVRWGRTTCPSNGTTLIYKGTVGGSHFDQSGSGADYQCLPDDPTWGKFQDGRHGSKAYMYGAEYEPSSLSFDGLGGKEVPCAVCLTIRSTTIMIPARTSCYPGWTLEYEGNLASAFYGHQRTRYICVDKNAESAPGSDSGSQDGALFYAVEARCGSLHCPPYVEGRELACVVCSK